MKKFPIQTLKSRYTHSTSVVQDMLPLSHLFYNQTVNSFASFIRIAMAQSVAVLSTIPRLSQHLRRLLPSVNFLDVQPGDILNEFAFYIVAYQEIHHDIHVLWPLQPANQKDTLSHLSKAEILVADASLLVPHIDTLTSAKWIQATWAGLETFIPQIREKKVSFTVTRFSGESFGYAMSEYVVSQIVNFERDQRRQYENQANLLWSQDGKVSDHRRISDLTVGILGLGEIGKFIAKALKIFGAQVWGMSRSAQTKSEHIDKHVTTESLPEILKNCDYIINVMPSTENTRGLLNGDVLQNCSTKKAVFINIGRGSIVTESDLVNAIEKNWISGAILDVFEEEPLPKNSKLWRFPQVTISPHVSGISRAEDVAKVFVENYKKYINGETMKNIVDVNRGY